ncbi:unnamed protein product [Ilex paraguariensis]|uniref:DRBM domain-containing protein n=1 Tax=Ilex paraguariensis TaxID=185542 RepID=A0ABC8TJZ9_9AQUA
MILPMKLSTTLLPTATIAQLLPVGLNHIQVTPVLSKLHEICAANHWNPPIFDCCKEEGPRHLKLFTFKVIILIREASTMILECIGNPRSKKKTAADDAAEGALWYLKHTGYQPKHRKNKKGF